MSRKVISKIFLPPSGYVKETAEFFGISNSTVYNVLRGTKHEKAAEIKAYIREYYCTQDNLIEL